jgi:hypothetical protein
MSAVTYQFLKNMADKLLVRAPAIRNLIKTAYHARDKEVSDEIAALPQSVSCGGAQGLLR